MTGNKNSVYNKKNYDLLSIVCENGVASVEINNPPVNVLSGKLMKELKSLLDGLALDQKIKTIVFSSANPEFFIAHVDINILDEQDVLEELGQVAPEGLNIFQAVGEMLSKQPQVTIVKLNGIARGGGAEFAAAADMCFASVNKGKLGQIEALMGIIPGGGATQYLSSKMPRGRVLEIILGADLFDAPTAERYGWINRALPDNEIDAFVDRLAVNIAALPEGVVKAAKQVLAHGKDISGFKVEHKAWEDLAFMPRTAQILKTGMENGAQTVEGELTAERLFRDIHL